MNRNPDYKKNLKPFKEGDDRINREGRPKKLPELDKLMAEVLGGEDDEKNEALEILRKIRQKAKQGNLKAAEILLNRAYGLPKQTVHNTGEMSVAFNYIQQAGNEPLKDDDAADETS
jgi:hypothetical protein